MNYGISSAIYRRRLALGLTQAELAERAGLTARAISFYECGKRAPTWATMKKLAAVLGKSIYC